MGFQEAFNLKLEKSNQDYKISVHIKTSNGDWSSGFSNTDVALEKWNHIAASYDGNSVQLYLNGVADGSFVKTGNLITSGGMSIGSRDINSEYFDGLIDDVQIWNKALSESEIQDRMYRPIDQTDPLWSDLSGITRWTGVKEIQPTITRQMLMMEPEPTVQNGWKPILGSVEWWRIILLMEVGGISMAPIQEA